MKKFFKLALTLFSCALVFLNAHIVSAKENIVLRLGYETPIDDSQHLAAIEFQKIVRDKTQGQIEIKLFPASSLGSAPALINGARSGKVDLFIVGTNNLAGIDKELSILDLPYLFSNTQEAFYILDGKIGQKLINNLDKLGIKGLAYLDNGFRQMSNNTKVIKSPEDVAGLKFRVPNNVMAVKLFKNLDASAIPMAVSELYKALDNGTLDGQDHPVGVFYSLKLYEVQKYLSLTNHQYSSLLFGMSKKSFEALSKEQQAIILLAAKDAAKFQRKYNHDNLISEIEKLKSMGVKVEENVDRKAFKDKCFDALAQDYIEQNTDALLKDIKSELANMHNEDK